MNDGYPHLCVHLQPFDVVDGDGAVRLFYNIERNEFVQTHLVYIFVVERFYELVG